MLNAKTHADDAKLWLSDRTGNTVGLANLHQSGMTGQRHFVMVVSFHSVMLRRCCIPTRCYRSSDDQNATTVSCFRSFLPTIVSKDGDSRRHCFAARSVPGLSSHIRLKSGNFPKSGRGNSFALSCLRTLGSSQ